MELHALGVLCGLAVVTFASLEAGRWRSELALVVGFIGATVLFDLNRFTDSIAVGIVAAGAAGLALFKPRFTVATIACGGLMAAVWVGVLEAQGLAPLLGSLIALSMAAVAAVLAARRQGFSPQSLRDEALVLVAVFGLLMAVVPQIVAGWRSAIALKSMPLEAETSSVAPWMIGLAAGFALLGGLYSMWKRR